MCVNHVGKQDKRSVAVTAEPIPKFSLAQSTKNKKEKAEILKRIQGRLASKPKPRCNFTPPKFDEKYIEAIRIMDQEEKG